MTAAEDLLSEAEAQARELAALFAARASLSELDAMRAGNAQLILKIAEYAQSQLGVLAWKKAYNELSGLVMGREPLITDDRRRER